MENEKLSLPNYNIPEDLEHAANTLRKARFASKHQFEQRFMKRLVREKYDPKELVLVRNTAVEMSHDRKHKPRYLGPYEVAERTPKGNYYLNELDGTRLQYRYAAYRILPYISRHHSFMKEHQDLEDEELSSSEELNIDTSSDESK